MGLVKPTWLVLSLFALIMAAYLFVANMEKRPFKIFQLPPRDDEPEISQKAQPPFNPSMVILDQKKTEEEEMDRENSIKELDVILYSDLNNEEILERLKPYLQIGKPLGDFDKKTRLRGYAGGTGPRNSKSQSWVHTYETGLMIVTDDAGNVKNITRPGKTINHKNFPSIQFAP